jgi:carboxypeptidase C (cathepsin A)
MMFLALLLVAVASSPTPVTLPGLSKQPSFAQYAGYVQVDAVSQRNLFYFFAESQKSPSTDPVVLWLTGGPGCSSLLAMMSENGPFRPDPKNPSQLVEDDYAWNRVANVVWLESPAGVGFSYSKNPGDYINVGDARTANDTFAFLQTFFGELFPQFRSNAFYITGER